MSLHAFQTCLTAFTPAMQRMGLLEAEESQGSMASLAMLPEPSIHASKPYCRRSIVPARVYMDRLPTQRAHALNTCYRLMNKRVLASCCFTYIAHQAGSAFSAFCIADCAPSAEALAYLCLLNQALPTSMPLAPLCLVYSEHAHLISHEGLQCTHPMHLAFIHPHAHTLPQARQNQEAPPSQPTWQSLCLMQCVPR